MRLVGHSFVRATPRVQRRPPRARSTPNASADAAARAAHNALQAAAFAAPDVFAAEQPREVVQV